MTIALSLALVLSHLQPKAGEHTQTGPSLAALLQPSGTHRQGTGPNGYFQKDKMQHVLVRMWRKRNPHALLAGM